MIHVFIRIMGILLLEALTLIPSPCEANLISQRKPVEMSSNYSTHIATYGVDGDPDTFFHTNNAANNWWRVDLLDVYHIRYVLMLNRKDDEGDRLVAVTISIGESKDNMTKCGSFQGPGQHNTMYTITCEGIGRFVELKQTVAEYFHLSEVEVYGDKVGTFKLISRNKPADMSMAEVTDVKVENPTENGVDGSRQTYFETGQYENSWFLINLLNVYKISYILMFNRQDSNGERLAKVNISIGNNWGTLKQCGYFPGPGQTGGLYSIKCEGTGKFVFLQQTPNERFHLSEVEVYGTELEIPIISGQCLDIRFDEQNYYEGTLSTAASGEKCMDFIKKYPRPNKSTHPKIYKDNFNSYKNYCRNPSNFIHQGCYTSNTAWKTCALRRCSHINEGYSQLLSYRKPATQSSNGYSTSGVEGVDGVSSNFFHTVDEVSWWRLDLIYLCEIRFILLFNRYNRYGNRLQKLEVTIGKDFDNLLQCAEFEGPGITHGLYNITCKAVGKVIQIKQKVNTWFHISEVEVYGEQLESSLISYKKPTTMSGKYTSTDKSSSGVDGDPSLIFHTNWAADSWWRVDLIDYYEMKYVLMVNRQDDSGWRLREVTVSIGGFIDNVTSCGFFQGPGATGETYKITTCKGRVGRIVELKQAAADYFHLGEVEVYGDKLVDGNWAEWTCPTVCENDKCTKTRTCTNPKPQHGGEDCPGKNISNEKCPILLSYRKPCNMSSLVNEDYVWRGVDGKYDHGFQTKSDKIMFWTVDLLEVLQISYVLIHNNKYILQSISVSVGKDLSNLKQCAQYDGSKANAYFQLECNGNGRHVYLQKTSDYNFLLTEVEVFGLPGDIMLLSQNKPTQMNSKSSNPNDASFGVDGDFDTTFDIKDDGDSFWFVNLLQTYKIMYNILWLVKDYHVTFDISVGRNINRLKNCASYEGNTSIQVPLVLTSECFGQLVYFHSKMNLNFRFEGIDIYGIQLYETSEEWTNWSACPSTCYYDGLHLLRNRKRVFNYSYKPKEKSIFSDYDEEEMDLELYFKTCEVNTICS